MIALCLSVINSKSGIIGYEKEGIKLFEIQKDESVKILSLKDSNFDFKA